MTRDDKDDLRDMRNTCENPEDKKLLRKVIDHIAALEARLFAVRVHAKSIIVECSPKSTPTNHDGD